MAAIGDEVLNQFQQKKKPQQVIDPERRLKVGIIGTGWIAESHIESYLRMPDVDIVAGADLIDGKAEAFFKDYGVENVRLYKNHHDLFDHLHVLIQPGLEADGQQLAALFLRADDGRRLLHGHAHGFFQQHVHPVLQRVNGALGMGGVVAVSYTHLAPERPTCRDGQTHSEQRTFRFRDCSGKSIASASGGRASER